MSLSALLEAAPFPADQVADLARIVGGSTAEQRLWMAGYLAGFEAASEGHATPAAPPAPKPRLTILYGTESGNTEALASELRRAAARRGFAPVLLDMADATLAQVARAETLLVLASTWGEGDPPQRAEAFYAALMGADAPRFDGVRFGVLALGDRAYAQFCATGRRIDERLAELGGQRVGARVDCDVDYAAPAAAWIETTLAEIAPPAAPSVIHVDFARPPAAAGRDAPFEAEILEHVNLNSSRSDLRTFHVGLSLEGAAIAYEPGDALGVLPSNDPEAVAAVLRVTTLAGDETLRAELATRFDVTTLTVPLLSAYAQVTGDAALIELASDPDRAREFVAGRHVIDLLETAPHPLAAGQLTGLLRPLQPRLYSIASSRRAVPDEAHLLVAAVGWESHGRPRKGVASRDIADRRGAGERLRVYLHANRHFRLPADPDRPIIMIGPGTGVAPFRAFLQERDALGAHGPSWLFFGARRFTHDFLYQLDWQDFLRRGVLSRMDVAFSRDQPEKIYVQDRMWAARSELYRWIADGAAVYVCGDAKAMARDVHASLARIIAEGAGVEADAAEERLRAMQRDGLYKRDVY